MSNVVIPSYLKKKLLPASKKNDISILKEKYGWEFYGDITEHELKKVYKAEIEKFWRIIRYLTFQGFKFSGKLNRYHYTNTNEIHQILYLQTIKESNVELDYDYRYAFLKLQLVPNGIVEKYDLHLLPLAHILNENLDVSSVETFLEEEGFTFLEVSSKSIDPLTVLNDKNKVKSIDKKITFTVGDFNYFVSKEKGNLSLLVDELPKSRILDVLIKKGYEKVCDIPRDLGFLTNIPYVGQRTVEKFFGNINEVSTQLAKPGSKKVISGKINSTIFEEKSFLYLGEKLQFKDEWMQIPISQEKIEDEVFRLFKDNKISLLGEIPFNLEMFLYEHGFGKVKSRELGVEVFKLLTLDALQELFSQTLKRISNNERIAYLSERDWGIVSQRIEGNTLEEIGENFGLTRERVRQIVKKSMTKVFSKYNKYFEYIADKIRNMVFVNIYTIFDDYDVVNIMRSIVKVYDLPFNVYEQYLFIGSSEEFFKKLEAIKNRITRENKYLYSREDIKQSLAEYLTKYIVKDTNKVDSKQIDFLTDDIIKEYFYIANNTNQYIYKHNLTKARMCQIVFGKEFANGLYIYREIDKFINKLEQYFPDEFSNDSSRSIIANLTRDENVVILWKVGFFKHISAIHPEVNSITLEPIKDWLQSQQSETTTQINANIAFEEFPDKLRNLEIDTEHALFSLLKIHYPDAFNYSRSPSLVMVGHERKEKRKIVEEYVKSCNNYVTNDNLIKYFIDTLGWKRSMYDQSVAASEDLIKTSDGLIHLNCLNILLEEFENILLFVKQKINQQQNSFSIETIFEERKSTLLQMNIKDSRVLYHLLEKYYPEEFDFYRYPHIHPIGKYEIKQLSVVGQFETFFLEEEDYFLRDELNEEFIQERGWSKSTYYMAFNKTRDMILEVFPEEFAHINLIEWTENKKEELVRILVDFLNKNDKPFVHIDREIISNDELTKQFPDINPMFDWNHTLLTSILQNNNNLILLGTRKAGILTKDNSYDIQNEHDYITYLLKSKFDGFVKVSDLQKYLYRIDMCGDSIPKYYLTPSHKELEYKLLNDEVILKELVVEQ